VNHAIIVVAGDAALVNGVAVIAINDANRYADSCLAH
jgi:hypothetical protein